METQASHTTSKWKSPTRRQTLSIPLRAQLVGRVGLAVRDPLTAPRPAPRPGCPGSSFPSTSSRLPMPGSASPYIPVCLSNCCASSQQSDSRISSPKEARRNPDSTVDNTIMFTRKNSETLDETISDFMRSLDHHMRRSSRRFLKPE